MKDGNNLTMLWLYNWNIYQEKIVNSHYIWKTVWIMGKDSNIDAFNCSIGATIYSDYNSEEYEDINNNQSTMKTDALGTA